MSSIQLDQPFPSFSLRSVDVREEKVVSNQSLAGSSYVIFVYPKDQTSGCTVEAQNFKELYSQFGEEKIEVLGLSRDSIRSHINFIKAQELPYPLLSDDGGKWLSENGLIYEAKMYGKPVTKVSRTTFFVDGEGVVRKVWENVSPPGHADEVLAFAREWSQGK